MFRVAGSHAWLLNLDTNSIDQEKHRSNWNMVLPENSPYSMDSTPN